jgi:hypothetical protein
MNGVRQGENLSPLLFALFLNDLQTCIEDSGGIGVKLEDDVNESNWLKLLVFLYADDTVIISDDPTDFQICLNAFNSYCREWDLTVNLNKTKVIVFGCRSVRNYEFKLGDNILDFSDTYHYLGIKFSSTGSFLNARKHIVEQSKKAMFLLFSKIRNADLPIDLSIKLFDHTVLPILTYGSEIFGFENLDMLESVHNDFLRKLLNARRSTPIYILHGELGRYPISVVVKSRMIGFWTRLLSGDHNKLSFKLYTYMVNRQTATFKWTSYVKRILDLAGRSYLWLNQFYTNIPLNTRALVKLTLIDQYKQQWYGNLQSSNKGKIYNSFKSTLEFESYFNLLPHSDALNLFKFRSSNHKFPVETGRWDGTVFNDRKCTLCDLDDLGTEKHYLLSCPFFMYQRSILTNKLNFAVSNTDSCFNSLLNMKSPDKLKHLSIFCKTLMAKFK